MFPFPDGDACREDAEKHCSSVVRVCEDKGCEIRCTASSPPPISKACRDLHPCAEDIERLCVDAPGGDNAMLRCLRAHVGGVSAACKRAEPCIERPKEACPDLGPHYDLQGLPFFGSKFAPKLQSALGSAADGSGSEGDNPLASLLNALIGGAGQGGEEEASGDDEGGDLYGGDEMPSLLRALDRSSGARGDGVPPGAAVAAASPALSSAITGEPDAVERAEGTKDPLHRHVDCPCAEDVACAPNMAHPFCRPCGEGCVGNPWCSPKRTWCKSTGACAGTVTLAMENGAKARLCDPLDTGKHGPLAVPEADPRAPQGSEDFFRTFLDSVGRGVEQALGAQRRVADEEAAEQSRGLLRGPPGSGFASPPTPPPLAGQDPTMPRVGELASSVAEAEAEAEAAGSAKSGSKKGKKGERAGRKSGKQGKKNGKGKQKTKGGKKSDADGPVPEARERNASRDEAAPDMESAFRSLNEQAMAQERALEAERARVDAEEQQLAGVRAEVEARAGRVQAAESALARDEASMERERAFLSEEEENVRQREQELEAEAEALRRREQELAMQEWASGQAPQPGVGNGQAFADGAWGPGQRDGAGAPLSPADRSGLSETLEQADELLRRGEAERKAFGLDVGTNASAADDDADSEPAGGDDTAKPGKKSKAGRGREADAAAGGIAPSALGADLSGEVKTVQRVVDGVTGRDMAPAKSAGKTRKAKAKASKKSEATGSVAQQGDGVAAKNGGNPNPASLVVASAWACVVAAAVTVVMSAVHA